MNFKQSLPESNVTNVCIQKNDEGGIRIPIFIFKFKIFP